MVELFRFRDFRNNRGIAQYRVPFVLRFIATGNAVRVNEAILEEPQQRGKEHPFEPAPPFDEMHDKLTAEGIVKELIGSGIVRPIHPDSLENVGEARFEDLRITPDHARSVLHYWGTEGEHPAKEIQEEHLNFPLLREYLFREYNVDLREVLKLVSAGVNHKVAEYAPDPLGGAIDFSGAMKTLYGSGIINTVKEGKPNFAKTRFEDFVLDPSVSQDAILYLGRTDEHLPAKRHEKADLVILAEIHNFGQRMLVNTLQSITTLEKRKIESDAEKRIIRTLFHSGIIRPRADENEKFIHYEIIPRHAEAVRQLCDQKQ